MRLGWFVSGVVALYIILGIEAAIRLGWLPITVGVTGLELALTAVFLTGFIRGGWFASK